METTRWKRAAQAAAADNRQKKETTTTIHPSIHLTSINESIEGHKRNLPSVETKHTHTASRRRRTNSCFYFDVSNYYSIDYETPLNQWQSLIPLQKYQRKCCRLLRVCFPAMDGWMDGWMRAAKRKKNKIKAAKDDRDDRGQQQQRDDRRTDFGRAIRLVER